MTVTQTFQSPDGSDVAAGQVCFDLVGPMHNVASGFTCAQVHEAPVLDGNGSISQPLFATDDPTTTPVGRTYYVTVDIVGAPAYSGYITVPHAAMGGTAVLDSLWVTLP